MTTQTQIPTRSKLLIKARKAFSLVELLVVIAVIGIIAAIAIPNIAGITGSANLARDQRNAQSLASVYSAAVAAGYTNAAITTSDGAADALVAAGGISVTNGTNVSSFGVPNLTGEALANAKSHLNMTNGQVIYNP